MSYDYVPCAHEYATRLDDERFMLWLRIARHKNFPLPIIYRGEDLVASESGLLLPNRFVIRQSTRAGRRYIQPVDHGRSHSCYLYWEDNTAINLSGELVIAHEKELDHFGRLRRHMALLSV